MRRSDCIPETKPLGLFADKLEQNLSKMNELFDQIDALFRSAGVGNFESLRRIMLNAANLPSCSNDSIYIWKRQKSRALPGR